MPITLFPDQVPVLQEIRTNIRAGEKRILLVSPTGWGKGTVCSVIIEGVNRRNKRALFIVRGRELVKDMSRRLDRLGIDHGVMMANHPRRRPWLNIHVASIDTIFRRETVPPADLLIADEAHLSLSDTWSKTLERYPNTPVVGMTATPILRGGAGLGSLYSCLVLGPGISELIQMGRLTPSRVFAPPGADLSGVKSTAGDFNEAALSQVCDVPKLTGDIVKTWLARAQERKTVCFPVDVKHSQHISEEFRCAGINAVHVDADTPDEERDRIWDDLDNGDLRVICSVGVTSYGWDHPIVSCGISARPTESLGLHLQQWGRIIRAHPGKRDALWLDHSGNVARHGFAEDDRQWTLDTGEKLRKTDYDPALAVRTCPKCWCCFSSRLDICPACNTPRIPNQRQIIQASGELQELRREQKEKAIEKWRERVTPRERLAKYEQLKKIAADRGYKPFWARIQYEKTFNEKPERARAEITASVQASI